MDVSTIIDYTKEYAIAIAAVVVLLAYLAVAKIRAHFAKKKNLAAVVKKIQPPIPAQTASTDDSLFAAFSPVKKEERKDVVNEIRNVNDIMRVNSAEMEGAMRSDFEKVRAQLASVNARKEHIRVYALELSKLFDRYREREAYLTSMLMQMEEMLKKR